MKSTIKKYFPGIIWSYHYLKLVREQKKLFPNKSKFNYSSYTFFADPYEKRGLALLRNKGNGQPFIKKYWRNAIALFNPEVVLDVGANYGEVFLDTRYPESVKYIFAVEANPFLNNYLRKSKGQHPKREKINIINGMAGEKATEENSFYIDKASSGRSTALQNNFVHKSHKVVVNSYRMDELITNAASTFKTLVFKIDVEGFEPFVLKGMTGLLDSDIETIGCIEFNMASFQKNNINVAEYLSFLNKWFFSLILKNDGTLADVGSLSIENLSTQFTNKYTEGDILLFTNKDHLETFKINFTK